MEATQTDIENPQLTSQEDGMVDSLAEGIMAQLDNTDPDHSGEAIATKPAETSAESEKEAEPEAEPETTIEEEPDEEDLYILERKGEKVRKTKKEYDALAHMGLDYTVKMQALADERNQLAPIAGLVSIIKSDPVKAQQIAAIISGQTTQVQQRATEKPQFDDPIEQLSYDIEQRVLAKTATEVQQKITPLLLQQTINQVKSDLQRDPDYLEIDGRIAKMVMDLPPELQRDTYNRLNWDPKTYLQAFQHFKNQKAEKPTTTTPPKPVKKETHAPILESGGVEAPSGIEGKAKTERISKMKAKALRDGNPVAIADWLKASGAIDHLY